jgi:hypothetical protein
MNAIALSAGSGGGISVSVSPTTISLTPSQTQQFTAAVTGTTNQTVAWSLSPLTGSITSGGLYTAPSSITTQQMVTVTATSAADMTKSASATVTLNPIGSGSWSYVQEGYAWCGLNSNSPTGEYCDPGNVPSLPCSVAATSNVNCTLQLGANVTAGDTLVIWVFTLNGAATYLTSICPSTYPGGVCTGSNLPLVKCSVTPGVNPGCTNTVVGGNLQLDAGYVLSAPAGLGSSFTCTVTNPGGYWLACWIFEVHWSGSGGVTFATSGNAMPSYSVGSTSTTCNLNLSGFPFGCQGLAFPGLPANGTNYFAYQLNYSGCSDAGPPPYNTTMTAPYVGGPNSDEGSVLNATAAQLAVAPYWSIVASRMPPACYQSTDYLPEIGLVFLGH